MSEGGLKNNLLRSQWSTISGSNCCGQTAELGQVWSCWHWFSQNGWFSQRAPWEDVILARYYCFSHEAPHMLKPVGNSDNFNCYLPIGWLCIYEWQEMCHSSSCVSAPCPASTGHQHVWPHWNTSWNTQRIPLYLSAITCWGDEACKATEVARLVSTWSAATQLLSFSGFPEALAPLCACLCVWGEALCLPACLYVQLQKLFTTDYRGKDVIMIITQRN